VLEIRRFDKADDFLDLAGPFLAAREPAHMLTLGSVGTIRQLGDRVAEGALVAVLHRGTVVATGAWTGPWELVVSEVDDPRAIDALVDAFADDPLPGVHAPVEHAAAFVERWTARTSRPARLLLRQRIHALNRVTPPTGVSGGLRRAVAADRDLLMDWMHAFDVESFGSAVGRRDVAALADELVSSRHRTGYLWDAGGPVSTASTTGRTPHGIRVGAVYTPPEQRGRGYATACVAAVSQVELDAGRRWCFLFTDLANPVSNRIYRRIGYEPVRDVDIYRFEAASAG
jgi:hypothetical protein